MQEQSIFIEALEKADPGERASFLDRVCAQDPALRQRIDKLLKRHDQSNRFLESPAMAVEGSGVESVCEGPGTVIGAYKLLEQIGEGGFGLVFMAEQRQPVRRKVAVKVLKPGMDTRQVVARFEAERQALALMDHPNIARVLEAGETSSGRPYFAMELVRGVPITDYCDKNSLTPRERLELFLTVCQAVQHAHQKGIIHRDLKPSNVLVTLHDGAPVVKVIDFGIAKALGQQLTEKTLYTAFAHMLGTPLYMSPEQTEMSGLDVDTRSDIYSLGVLLYELLTGTTPFDKERLNQAGYDEMRRIIREEEPVRPSTRLSTLGYAAVTVSERRRSDPRRLSRLFRGELDWIVMKALEKERGRRYETASAFAGDVEHYLHDEPVTACPPSTWYRFRKFARRKRAALAMALVIAAALGLAAIVMGGSIGWALRDRDAREAAIARDRSTREAALDEEVDRALAEAAAVIDTVRWPAAAAPLARAEKLLTAAGRPKLPPRLRELQRDLAMGRRLDEIAEPFDDLAARTLGYWTLEKRHATDVAYGRAFKDYGIDLAALTVAEAAQRIGTRGMRFRLACALDFWSFHLRERTVQPAGPGWKHLLQIAKAVDPDPWRNQVRDLFLGADEHMLLTPAAKQAMRALIAKANIRDLPPETLLLLAWTLDDDKARVAFLRKAQMQYPDDVRLNHRLAWACEVNKEYDEAVRFYTAALVSRPDSQYLRVRIAQALWVKGALPAAVEVLTQAIELKPDAADTLLVRAMVFNALNRPDKALADYSKVIELDPQSAFAWSGRAFTHERRQEWVKALSDYDEAIRLVPAAASYMYLYGRGRVHAILGQWVQAAADVNAAVMGVQPAQDHMWMELAVYRLGSGDVAGYNRACRDMLVTFATTESPVTAHRVALSCLLLPDAVKDPSVAQRLAKVAATRSPKDPWCLLTEGAALCRSGQYQPAADQLRLLLKQWPQAAHGAALTDGRPVMAWLWLALADHQLGKRQQARQWLDRAVKVMDHEAAEKTIGPLRQQSHVWIMCLVLRAEAQEFVRGVDSKK